MSKQSILFLLHTFALGPATISASELESSLQPNWTLVWSDEFDTDGAPDTTKWTYDIGGHGWGNKELQFYTDANPENARVEDGRLVIEAHKAEFEGRDYTSARLVTRDRQTWKYGRFEIRAKLPEGLGTWPAIWMLPVDWNLGSGKWPDVGEIDIMEHVGYDLGTIHASAHSKSYQWQAGTQKTATVYAPEATKAFHTYALEWSEAEINVFIDNHLFFTYQNENTGWESWPYQRDYYLILNLAVGGEWGAAKGIDPESFPQRMEIDYVRVYQQSGSH